MPDDSIDRLAAALIQLENARIVHRLPDLDPAYDFNHALTQETAYESLLVKRRREVHRRVAEAYRHLYADRLDEFAAVLAAHYAEAGEDARTVEYATRAGALAAQISAYTEARTYLATALDALSRLPDTEPNRRARVDTILKQIEVAWGIDSAEQNLARLSQAETLAMTFPEREGTRLARIHYWIGRVYSYQNEHRQAARYYEQVIAAARESGDDELMGLAAALGGRAFFLQGYFGKAVPLLEQAVPHLERIANWQEWVLAKVSLAISLAAQGHYREGRRHGDEAVEKALELNDQTSIASARGMTARVEFMAGDLERMLDEVRVVEQEAQGANPLVHYMIMGFKAWGQARLGRLDAARATMAAADAIASRFGTRLIFADWFAAARAEIEFGGGAYEQARQLAEQAVAEAEATGGIFSQGIAERVWGQALAAATPPDYRAADTHLHRSAGLFEEGEAIIEAARTQLAWGQVLLSGGQAPAARAHLQQAAHVFRAAGLTRELGQAERLIESAVG